MCKIVNLKYRTYTLLCDVVPVEQLETLIFKCLYGLNVLHFTLFTFEPACLDNTYPLRRATIPRVMDIQEEFERNLRTLTEEIKQKANDADYEDQPVKK